MMGHINAYRTGGARKQDPFHFGHVAVGGAKVGEQSDDARHERLPCNDREAYALAAEF